jgi:hypothetical protein
MKSREVQKRLGLTKTQVLHWSRECLIVVNLSVIRRVAGDPDEQAMIHYQ